MMLHRVTPVTHGKRLAVVGWVASLIRDVGARKILFGLDQAIAASVDSTVVDRLGKVRSYLLRRWAGR
ncbi:MAG: PKHD-type hydroxylase [Paracoccaceae bacterium]|jgi:PKHD-type hydroxylase